MKHGKQVAVAGPERWITQIENGVVTLVQRIEADAFVVQSHDLPALCANEEIIPDILANDISLAIFGRSKME